MKPEQIKREIECLKQDIDYLKKAHIKLQDQVIDISKKVNFRLMPIKRSMRKVIRDENNNLN